MVISWLLSVLASALPDPEEIWPQKTGAHYFVYRTFYKALHTYCGNVGRIFKWMRLSTNGKANQAKGESDDSTKGKSNG